ncbi:hypothetical protein PHJA_000342500 [Phtheirospermum japonicum]|uniref:Uncharacterized protein n=1 Tax=Phtheirospermum japonicum TaxID=374723 RepID=A0A830B824_9LAMI|nr:hypothetical protein PHJA_000342500 [Phtheirospermum japonicum]
MLISGKQLPPQWSIPDFVRTVLGNEAVQSPSSRNMLRELCRLHRPSMVAIAEPH